MFIWNVKFDLIIQNFCTINVHLTQVQSNFIAIDI